MFIGIAALLFAGFAFNVAMGAWGAAPLLGDVSEMLLLFAAAVSFVVAILKSEAAAE